MTAADFTARVLNIVRVAGSAGAKERALAELFEEVRVGALNDAANLVEEIVMPSDGPEIAELIRNIDKSKEPPTDAIPRRVE